jgi:hypothetical protein
MDYKEIAVSYEIIPKVKALVITLGTGVNIGENYLEVGEQIICNPDVDVVLFKNWEDSDDIGFYLDEVAYCDKKAGLIGKEMDRSLMDRVQYFVNSDGDVEEIC